MNFSPFFLAIFKKRSYNYNIMKSVKKSLFAAFFAASFAMFLSLALAGCDNGSSSPVLYFPPAEKPSNSGDQTTSLPNPFAVPLTLEAVSGSVVVTFSSKASKPVTYKVNGGDSQTVPANSTKTITLANAGDKVEFWGDNNAYTYIPDVGISQDSNVSCSADCYIYGNIMSLVKSSNFSEEKKLEGAKTFECFFKDNVHLKNKEGSALLLPATTLTENCYLELFYGCSGLTSAPTLPATTLADWCYAGMFQGCAGLAETPALPAETMTQFCYSSMFENCANLEKAAELPAKTLSPNCYEVMFKDCVKLKDAPAIKAEKLDFACCKGMFHGCTSLTAAPALPVTKLENYCYENMFYGCTSLATAPTLPATKLEDCCYINMFYGCSSLSSVTCLATDISASNCTADWLNGVSASGTFTKAAGMTDWPTDSASGIPSGWTVVDKQ